MDSESRGIIQLPAGQSAVEQAGRIDDPMLDDLAGRSARGGMLMVVSEAAQTFLGFISTLVLARLLMPEDFGVIAMVAGIMGLIAAIRDFGLPMATSQQRRVSSAQLTHLFWFNLKLTAILSVALIALAPAIAWFYRDGRLVLVTLAMTACTVAAALGTVQMGLLRRQMRYGVITAIEFTCAAAGIAVAIFAAKAGAGYWAIVLKVLTENLSTSAAVWIASGWRVWPPGAPQLPESSAAEDDAIPALVSYGKFITYTRLVNYFGKNIDVVLLGRFAGAGPAGLYDKAEQLGTLTFQQFYFPLVNVAVSSFSRLLHDPERYRFYFRKALIGLFGLTAPLMIFAVVNADVIIKVVLGTKWLEAIPLARALTLSVLFGSTLQVARWVNQTEGATQRQFNWSLISTPILIAGVLCGLPRGAIGVAWGYTIAMALLAYPGLAYSMRDSVLTINDFVRAVWRPVLAAAIAGAVVLAARKTFDDPASLILQLFRDATLYGMTYLICWIATPSGRSEMHEMLSLLRHFRMSGQAAPIQPTLARADGVL